MKTSSGGPLQVATANDTTKTLSVIGEATAVSENDPVFAGFTSNTDTLTSGVVKISNQLLQDAEFDLDTWLQTTFGTRYYRGLSQMIAHGNSSNILLSLQLRVSLRLLRVVWLSTTRTS